MTTPPRPKGHWPRGKRRNADRGDWAAVRVALAALLRHHHRPRVVSARALAEALGVWPTTVGRWLRGTDRPEPHLQERVSTWVAERQAQVERERRDARRP